MKITVEQDGQEPQVFDEVSDAYLCVRQLKPYEAEKGGMSFLIGTRSLSWGSDLRELVKELRQSLLELEEIMRTQ